MRNESGPKESGEIAVRISQEPTVRDEPGQQKRWRRRRGASDGVVLAANLVNLLAVDARTAALHAGASSGFRRV